MFALEVEYLTGRAAAAERHAREEAEWPPHPGRLFSTLVDAAFQSFSPDGLTLPGEFRAALKWLEALPPPALSAGEAGERDAVQSFVPVNDAAAPEVRPDAAPSRTQIGAARAVLPDHRGRQPRYFPSVSLDDPIVHFVWREAPGVEVYRPALERLASRTTYLGSSSSLVRAVVVDQPRSPNWLPDPSGGRMLRVPEPGRLRALEDAFRRDARPPAGRYVGYKRVDEAAAKAGAWRGTVFGDMIICRIDGPRLPLSGAAKLTAAVRDALIARVDAGADPSIKEELKSLVSGHAADGSPSREVHVAYAPLANLGFNYSDGRVMGFAVVLPRTLGRFSPLRRAILTAAAGLERVWFGGSGSPADPLPVPHGGFSWNVSLAAGDAPQSLRTWAYTGRSDTWATVTPFLCDRHPKEKRGERIEDVVAESIERVVGLKPVFVEVGESPWWRGAPSSRAFHDRRRPGLSPRRRVHVCVRFKQAVHGPILAGAGRYAGLGLFRACPRKEQA